MSKLDIENSLVERNGSFLESVSTTFVYDCRIEKSKYSATKAEIAYGLCYPQVFSFFIVKNIIIIYLCRNEKGH